MKKQVHSIDRQGNITVQEKEFPPLSKEEQELRKPLPPEILIDALQDSIHKEMGKPRIVKRSRVRSN